MLLDVTLLRRAKVENVERLARSLGVEVPARKGLARAFAGRSTYQNQLVMAVARELRRDAARAELSRLS